MLKFLLFCPLLIVLYIQIAVPRPVLCHINIKRMEHFNERWCNKNRDWGFWRSWNLALRQRNTVSLITRKWEISCEDWGISIIGTVYLQSWQTFLHLDFFLCLQKGISVHRKLRIRTGARRLRLFSLKIWFLIFLSVLNNSEKVLFARNYDSYFYISKQVTIHKIILNLSIGFYEFLVYLWNKVVIIENWRLLMRCSIREKFPMLMTNYITFHETVRDITRN